MPSRPKRHHQIPLRYLERFSSEGKVCVLRRDGVTFEASPVNVAVESGYYDVPDGLGGKSTEVEALLSRVERAGHEALGEVDRTQLPPPEGSERREALALFIALQMSRTTEHRERTLFPRRVLDWAEGRELTRDLVADYLEREHLGFVARDPEVDGAFFYVSEASKDPHVLTPEWAIEMMLGVVRETVPRLLALSWSIEIDRRREFITSDMPVIPWRKPTRRDNYEGLGIDKAEEMRFPLDPGKQLVLSRRKRAPTIEVEVHRVRRSNADLAAACHRFIVGSPLNRDQIASQRLHGRRPVIRFNVGPLFIEGASGQLEKQPGDVLQMWVPRNAGAGRPRTRS